MKDDSAIRKILIVVKKYYESLKKKKTIKMYSCKIDKWKL